jgi:hypothetical protein
MISENLADERACTSPLAPVRVVVPNHNVEIFLRLKIAGLVQNHRVAVRNVPIARLQIAASYSATGRQSAEPQAQKRGFLWRHAP